MKSLLIILLLAVLITGIANAQTVPSPLKQMVQTEQAFSKTAEEKDTRDAFMSFIADDGLLFRPNAVNGKKWMQDHPVPASDKHPLLAWQPVFARVAASGDLGFTTGPWEFKSDRSDEKASGYGHFVTIWKKQADGSWKFAVDLGISHPDSAGPLKLWDVSDERTPKPSKLVNVLEEQNKLIAQDRAFSDQGLKGGLIKAFTSFSASDIRLYRNDRLPFVGREASLSYLSAIKLNFVWKPTQSDVARSGDLGYTVGTYEAVPANDPGGKVTELGNYLRIWQKQSGSWRIVLDVTNPVP
ncbi:MAG TPA: nuclear transport factor 2 family protein [Pyrinomonadaceae bacterium]|nr:nuclear transport factor 2 family protein [Pyrinomonadaceae bacterium]